MGLLRRILRWVEASEFHPLELGVYVLFGVSFLWTNAIEAAAFSAAYRRQHRAGLHPGWLPWLPAGQALMDLKDAQYHSWRENACLMIVVFTAMIAGSNAVQFACAWMASKRDPEALCRWRVRYYAIFGVIFVSVVHGTDVAYLFIIIAVNYMLSELCVHTDFRGTAIATVWGFACTTVIMNERHRGYGAFQFAKVPVIGRFTGFLDGHLGLSPWHHRFPLVMLRMISFSMDRSWATFYPRVTPALTLVGGTAGASTTAIVVVDPKTDHPDSYYGFESYLAYLFYPPLYVAGPIMTYNSFVSSIKGAAPVNSLPKKLIYGARAAACFVVYETFLHYIYIGAIVHNQFYYQLLANPLWCIVFGYVGVNALYLKFLVIWRFFRFWAIADEVVPPENMPQCITVTTTISNFWRGWHSSYNKWLVRYIYIPLGGSLRGRGKGGKGGSEGGGNGGENGSGLPTPVTARFGELYITARKLLNTAIVFTFVAVWHDQKMALLAWSWVLIASMVPEQVAGMYLATRHGKAFQQHWSYRHLRACGSVFCITTLIAANIIGFSAGLKGTVELMQTSLLGGGTAVLMAKAFAHLFAMSHINIEIRKQQEVARQQVKDRLPSHTL